ncbi:LamG-like jellyroll fold domain-containing protein [Kribbella sp. CA-293567]|uniref:LamG-like jellyroll fold domain-containing protein n=1 Tax=Kribbella sp. CA-293567 TaxID=3002436 RepID=UPI0022DD02B1|nr:LamG-like jellyroll fold domain-containing protein [Kribbella sp. CA-293567]WBQ07543.1 hypothetical protein OX958_12230 [Kribbella sp. CA-293567]
MYRRTLPTGRRAGTRRAIAAVCALSLGVLGWLSATPGTKDQTAAAAPTSAAADDKSATTRAKASGQRVEVLRKRTESEQTFANPDGTFVLEQSNVPVRTKKDGDWVDLDATLSTGTDGRVRPKAASLDMSFSGGGTDPLISMKSDGHELKLKWPGTLPEPVVADDAVTYPNVFPDVDLKITASTSSYREVLVVKTPEAARLPQLQSLDLALEAPGLNVAEAPGGAILAKDGLGKVIFTGPAPTMWDSRGKTQSSADQDRTEAPIDGDKIVQIPLEVDSDSLKISPPATLLNDTAVKYPLHIDPGFGTQQGRAMIDGAHPTSSYWNWTGTEGVGYQNFSPPTRKRLIYKFTIAGLTGARVIGAQFSAYETWSASCTKREVQAWKTAAISTGINWNNGSGSNVWLKELDSVVDAAGWSSACSPNGKWLEFNVLTAVAEQAAAGSGWLHLGLRASETDALSWKRFRPDAKISVTYNHIPAIKSMATSNPTMGCAPATAPAIVNARNPIPKVTVQDIDRQPTSVGFEFWTNNQTPARWRGASLTKVNGAGVLFMPQAQVTMLSPNNLTGWRARAWDGYDYSPWSKMCYFYIDTTEPPIPTVTVEGSDTTTFPLNQPVTVSLSSTRADTNYFKYTIDSEEPTSEVVQVSPGTFTFTPRQPGPLVIRAWSFDRAGNRSVKYGEERIKVATGITNGRWFMNEGTGTVLADGSGKRHSLQLGTGQWTTGDRWFEDEEAPVVDHAVALNGNATVASADPDIVDTSRSFTVSARVAIGTKTTRQVAVSEDRAGSGGFTLGLQSMDLADPGEPKASWSFSIPDPNGTGQVTVVSAARAYSPGDWVYLTGIYDSTRRELSLLVDGNDVTPPLKIGADDVPISLLPGIKPAPDGTGQFRVGSALVNGTQSYFLNGKVDDVRIYPGPIDEDTIDQDALETP